jgi:hypothetical protein
MSVSKEYDKFDNKYEYTVDAVNLTAPSDPYGLVRMTFAYIVGNDFELGWLILFRSAERWGWLEDNRLILVGDNLRVEHLDGLRESEVQPQGGIFERIDVGLTKEQCIALANSTENPQGRIDGFVFTLDDDFMADVKQAVQMGLDRA